MEATFSWFLRQLCFAACKRLHLLILDSKLEILESSTASVEKLVFYANFSFQLPKALGIETKLSNSYLNLL